MTVDEFVESKVRPEYQGIVAELRKLMREAAPDAREVMSYGLPMYRQNSVVVWISPSKTGIKFSFTHGVEFEDRYRLLRTGAKHAKHVKLKKLGEVNKPALRYYVKQALKFDKR